MDQIQYLYFPLIKLLCFLSLSFFLLLPQGCCPLSAGLFVLWLIFVNSLVPSPESWLQEKSIQWGLLPGGVKWWVMRWFACEWTSRLRRGFCVKPLPNPARAEGPEPATAHWELVLSFCEPPAAPPSISPNVSSNEGENFLWELLGKSGVFRGYVSTFDFTTLSCFLLENHSDGWHFYLIKIITFAFCHIKVNVLFFWTICFSTVVSPVLYDV